METAETVDGAVDGSVTEPSGFNTTELAAHKNDIQLYPVLLVPTDSRSVSTNAGTSDLSLDPTHKDIVMKIADAAKKELKGMAFFERLQPPDEEMSTMIDKTNQRRFTVRLSKVVLMFLIPTLFGVPIIRDDTFKIQVDNYQLPKLFAYALVAVFFFYFVLFVSIFIYRPNGGHLFRVYSVSSLVPNWGTRMSLTFEALMFPNNAIESVSEFSAISGGIAHNMLLNLSVILWAVLLIVELFVLYLAQLNYITYEWMGTSSILTVLGAFGVVLFGAFESDAFNLFLATMHAGGAVLGVGTYAGYAYQQYRLGRFDADNIDTDDTGNGDDYYGESDESKDKNDIIMERMFVPIVLAVIIIVAFIVWRVGRCMASSHYNETEKQGVSARDNEEIRAKVGRISVLCVLSETVFLFAASACVVLYIFHVPECLEKFERNCY